MSKSRFLLGMIGVVVGVSSTFAQPVGPGGGFYWDAPVNGNWFVFENWDGYPNPMVGPPNSQTTAHMAWTEPYTVFIENAQAQCHHLSVANTNVTLNVRPAGGNSSLWTYGTELNNDGLVLLGGVGSTAHDSALIIGSACTLRYAGTLRMAPAAGGTTRIAGNSGVGYLLIHENPHVIEGNGTISVPIQNNSLIHANAMNGSLTFSHLLTNNATIRASNGGQLWFSVPGLSGGVQQSASGAIVVEDGSSCWFQGAGTDGFSGGQLATQGSGVFKVFTQGFRIQQTTLAAGSLMEMVGNSGINIGPNGITNNGLINLGATGFCASGVGQSAAIGGTGRLQMEGGQLGVFLDGFSYTLVNQSQHTIGGFGNIQAHLTNHGTIAADRNGLNTGPTDLMFTQAPKTNHGLITATGTGTITVSSTQITQGAFGTLHAGDGSRIALSTASVFGGRLSTSGTGVIFANGSGETLDGVTILSGSQVAVPCGRTLNLSGNVTNNGTLSVENSSCGPVFAYLRAPAGASLGGSGEIRLARSLNSAAAALWGDGGAANPLNVGSGQSITGSGSLYGTINVNGVIAPHQTFGGSGPIGAFHTAVNTGGGAITLGAQAHLEIDIASASSYDRILGNATLALDGMLDVSVISGFQPSAGNVFTIASGSSITGSFDNAVPNGGGIGQLVIPEGTFVVTYSPTSVTLSGFAPGSVYDQGDMNCDGTIDGHDIAAFTLALTQPAAYPVRFPFCNIANGDVNEDTVVNASDIAPFAALVLGH